MAKRILCGFSRAETICNYALNVNDFEGDLADAFAFLEIDIHQLPAGIYALTVTVADRRTGQSVEQRFLFRVVE